MSIALPDDSQHLTLLGRNGTGKTVGAIAHLSVRSWDRMPWIIFDYKREINFRRMEKDGCLKEIDFRKDPPRNPGLYIVRPIPGIDDEAVNEFLMKIWARGRTGLYFDEGYMVSGNEFTAMTPLYTQGRSKRIPIIALFQRPVWMTRFAISESTFFQIYDIHDVRDRKTIIQYVPPFADVELKQYHSLYYDVKRNAAAILTPVPKEAILLERIRERHRKAFGTRWL